MNRLVLGTAQLGMDYGINNRRGRVPEEEAFLMLDYARSHGMTVLDTAPAYGNSEEVIGRYIEKNGCDLNIISKSTATDPDEIDKQFDGSLRKLRVGRLYGYLAHSFQHYADDIRPWDAFMRIRASGRTERIGFSLYFPSELDILMDCKIPFDIVQVPYSILDQRFADRFRQLKARGVEVHTRSAFLQGLFFKDASAFTGRFAAIRDKVAEMNDLAKRCNVPLETLCLSFVALNPHIDKIVVGSDSLEHLKKNIEGMGLWGSAQTVYDELLRLRVDEEDIVVPSHWTA